MSELEIRSLQGEELIDVMFSFNTYAFRASPPRPNKEEFAEIVRERKGVTYHVLYEDENPIAAAASTIMTQNVRGKLFPAGGVWAVATSPGARRKGYSRRVLTSLLESEYQAGRAFSNLHPFRESFYERLGYVTFPLPIIAKLEPRNLNPLLKKDFGGSVELKLIGEAYDLYRDFLTEMRKTTHGMTFFDAGDRKAAERNPFWVALAQVNGKTEGFMLYQLKGEEVTHFSFRALRFYSHTSRGRYLLLDWIARHVDQAATAEIWLPPTERPETWLSDLKLKVESATRAPMGRVLNVQKLDGMETGAGRFSVEITDPICPWNEGVWSFESQNGKLKVSPGSKADGSLTIQGLTALILGAHELDDFPFRGWGDPSPELQAIMRSVFPPMTPFMHESF